MKSKKKLGKICKEIYREMYQESEPKADFDKIIESGEGKKEEWFMNYYLSEERQVEITERVMKNHKCSKYERKAIRFEVYLGCSPCSVKNKKRMERCYSASC